MGNVRETPLGHPLDMTLGPLAGYTIGVTADRRWEEQAELLERRGARVVHGPTIRTLALGDEEVLGDAIAQLVERPPDVVVLITALGLRGWFATAESLNQGEALLQALLPARVYARGPKAAGAAMTAGLEVAWNAPNARGIEILDQLAHDLEAGLLPGRRLALQLDGSTDTYMQDALRDLGFDVVLVPIYRWMLPLDVTPAVRLMQSVADCSVDAVTFTAGAAVANFFALAKEQGLFEPVVASFNSGAVDAICVGPVCAARARSFGVNDAIEPMHPRLGAMVQACASVFSERSQGLRLGGHDVRLQGRFVLVDDGDPISLSDRERGVLHALAERPGVVHPKASLLAAIWGDGESDEHVVEVTVGRLRQRLGPAGVGVETVVRRGYRLSAD